MLIRLLFCYIKIKNIIVSKVLSSTQTPINVFSISNNFSKGPIIDNVHLHCSNQCCNMTKCNMPIQINHLVLILFEKKIIHKIIFTLYLKLKFVIN